MKIKVLFWTLLFSSFIAFSQHSYRKDSLQIKVYSELYVNENVKIDSIKVKKIFCEFCTDNQLKAIKEESYYRTQDEFYNPKYHKEGKHIIAIYLRISKDDFSKMKE